jgi:hypothetical protein
VQTEQLHEEQKPHEELLSARETCISTELKAAIANWFMKSSELFVDGWD